VTTGAIETVTTLIVVVASETQTVLWRVHVCVRVRSGKQGKLTVRTEDEENDVKTGVSPGSYSVLDLSYSTKFYVGGVLDQAVDAVCLSPFLPVSVSVSPSLSLRNTYTVMNTYSADAVYHTHTMD